MARQVIIGNNEDDTQHPYTMIETLEDIGRVPCHAPEEDLIARFNEGETILVNSMGGYCFFSRGYNTIIS